MRRATTGMWNRGARAALLAAWAMAGMAAGMAGAGGLAAGGDAPAPNPDPFERLLTLEMDNVAPSEALDALSAAAGVKFAYDAREAGADPVTLRLVEAPLDPILQTLGWDGLPSEDGVLALRPDAHWREPRNWPFARIRLRYPPVVIPQNNPADTDPARHNNIAAMLRIAKELFPDRPAGTRWWFDPDTNSVVVRSTPRQIRALVKMLEPSDVPAVQLQLTSRLYGVDEDALPALFGEGKEDAAQTPAEGVLTTRKAEERPPAMGTFSRGPDGQLRPDGPDKPLAVGGQTEPSALRTRFRVFPPGEAADAFLEQAEDAAAGRLLRPTTFALNDQTTGITLMREVTHISGYAIDKGAGWDANATVKTAPPRPEFKTDHVGVAFQLRPAVNKTDPARPIQLRMRYLRRAINGVFEIPIKYFAEGQEKEVVLRRPQFAMLEQAMEIEVPHGGTAAWIDLDALAYQDPPRPKPDPDASEAARKETDEAAEQAAAPARSVLGRLFGLDGRPRRLVLAVTAEIMEIKDHFAADGDARPFVRVEYIDPAAAERHPVPPPNAQGLNLDAYEEPQVF